MSDTIKNRITKGLDVIILGTAVWGGLTDNAALAAGGIAVFLLGREFDTLIRTWND